jgi:hypothetical protein
MSNLEEAVVLDMGQYSLPAGLQAAAAATMGSSRAGSPLMGSEAYMQLPSFGLFGGRGRASYRSGMSEHSSAEQLRLVQLLAPALVGRARVFGNALALRPDMVCEDMPYFDGPGTAVAPLGPEPCLQVELPEVGVALGTRFI